MGTTAAARLRNRATQIRTEQATPKRTPTRQERYERQQQERDRKPVNPEKIREVLALPQAKACRCVLWQGMTVGELRDLGAGCTSGQFVCPTLDTLRRRIEK